MNQENSIGPAKIPFTTFLLKILAGTGGGVVGTLVLVLIFLLANSVLTPLSGNFATGDYISPIFIFLLMIMVFLSSTVGNMLSVFLLALTEPEKYKRKATAVTQVFIVSLVIFLVMVPVYFLTTSIDVSVTAYAVALHIIISAQVSAIILEIISNYKHALVGVYGVTFSILVAAGLLFGIAGLTDYSAAILLFIALPVVWGSIAFTQSVVTMIYGWFARVYDKDFLASETFYGKDYGKELETPQQKSENKAKDEKGADFLRNN
ncbi:hypothetical protein JKY72_06885 [Candidatus Gracilibacteria bacterium]|nr:hypothetical protein [Candidatus Gracilibacteria bacterium]